MLSMRYSAKQQRIVLEEGTYKGIPYRIVSLGTHPCAYIGIAEDQPYYQCSYYSIPIDVHGGLTYENFEDGIWWIGWDYAHASDYHGMLPQLGGRKWTTGEIRMHVWNACEQLTAKGGEKDGRQ